MIETLFKVKWVFLIYFQVSIKYLEFLYLYLLYFWHSWILEKLLCQHLDPCWERLTLLKFCLLFQTLMTIQNLVISNRHISCCLSCVFLWKHQSSYESIQVKIRWHTCMVLCSLDNGTASGGFLSPLVDSEGAVVNAKEWVCLRLGSLLRIGYGKKERGGILTNNIIIYDESSEFFRLKFADSLKWLDHKYGAKLCTAGHVPISKFYVQCYGCTKSFWI